MMKNEDTAKSDSSDSCPRMFKVFKYIFFINVSTDVVINPQNTTMDEEFTEKSKYISCRNLT